MRALGVKALGMKVLPFTAHGSSGRRKGFDCRRFAPEQRQVIEQPDDGQSVIFKHI